MKCNLKCKRSLLIWIFFTAIYITMNLMSDAENRNDEWKGFKVWQAQCIIWYFHPPSEPWYRKIASLSTVGWLLYGWFLLWIIIELTSQLLRRKIGNHYYIPPQAAAAPPPHLDRIFIHFAVIHDDMMMQIRPPAINNFQPAWNLCKLTLDMMTGSALTLTVLQKTWRRGCCSRKKPATTLYLRSTSSSSSAAAWGSSFCPTFKFSSGWSFISSWLEELWF